MRNKTILLAMPPSNGIVDLIAKNLQFHGYEVFRVDSILDFEYASIKDRISNFFIKHALRNNNYKEKLKAKQCLNKAELLIGNKQYDYTIVIRPDLYPKSVLEMLKQQTKIKFIGYQWDGLKRFPVINLIHLFDKFYIFDHTDIINKEYKKYHLHKTTNFYFDMLTPHNIKNDVMQAYYIGDHQTCRVQAIEQCITNLTANGIKTKFIIPTSKRKDINCYQSKHIIFGKENRINYFENLKNVNSSDILVDFVVGGHHGLSFRHFEALYYQKKLITTNIYVKNYDFYHPENIYIWEDKTHNDIKDFLKEPFKPIKAEIFQKYSFKNWIEQILYS